MSNPNRNRRRIRDRLVDWFDRWLVIIGSRIVDR
jgi:hypothetical protein